MGNQAKGVDGKGEVVQMEGNRQKVRGEEGKQNEDNGINYLLYGVD